MKVIPFLGIMSSKGDQWGLWDAGGNLYINTGASYMGMRSY